MLAQKKFENYLSESFTNASSTENEIAYVKVDFYHRKIFGHAFSEEEVKKMLVQCMFHAVPQELNNFTYEQIQTHFPARFETLSKLANMQLELFKNNQEAK